MKRAPSAISRVLQPIAMIVAALAAIPSITATVSPFNSLSLLQIPSAVYKSPPTELIRTVIFALSLT